MGTLTFDAYQVPNIFPHFICKSQKKSLLLQTENNYINHQNFHDMKKLIIALMLFVPVALFAQKFGHVDTQAIMTTLPEIAKINGELQALAKKHEDQLIAMQNELKRKAEDYDKNKSTMNAMVLQQTENALQEENQKIQQAYTRAQHEMEAKQKEMMEPIYEKVKTAIKNVGKAGQYTYIFEQDAALYVGVGSKDLTNEVKAEIARLK